MVGDLLSLSTGLSETHTYTHALHPYAPTPPPTHRLWGRDRTELLERLVVADLKALPVGGSTLSVFMNERGGIHDDTIVNKQPDHYYIVSNAACADKDLALLHKHLRDFLQQNQAKDVRLEVIHDQSLLAFQGTSGRRGGGIVGGRGVGSIDGVTNLPTSLSLSLSLFCLCL